MGCCAVAERDPDVQPSTARHLVRSGRTIEVVFHHGDHANMEHLTPHQAHQLQAKLQMYLWALRVEALERDPEQADYEEPYHG